MSTEPFSSRVTHDVFCVLYAQGTGEIVFVHRVITLGNAQPQREEEIEADARRIMQTKVGAYQERSADLIALMVSPEAFQRGRTYAVVDCSTRTLIETRKAPTTTN